MNPDLAVPTRQHPLGVIILATKFSWHVAKAGWPALLGLSFGNIKWYHLLVVPAVFLVVGGFAFVYYLRFRFYVEADALIVERGIFQRERLQIPFERIQAVQLFQGPIQQLFGLTGLRVDTAGSSGNEVELVAVKLSEAEGLQQFLRSKMDGPREGGGVQDAEGLPPPDTALPEADPLVSLGWADLLKVGLSQNHIRSAFIGLAVVLSLFQGIEEQVSTWIAGLPAMALAFAGLAATALILPSLVLMMFIGVATSVVSVVLKYWKLHSTLGEDSLSLQMGLLRRNVFEVPFQKIHLTEWKSNWLRRALGYETLRIQQAQAEGGRGGVRIFIPAMQAHHRAAMEERLYPDIGAGEVVFDVVPARRLRWILFALAASPALVVLSSPQVVNVLMGLLWLGFVFWTTGQRYSSLRMKVYRNAVVLERGWFWRTRTVIKLSQLQGVEWKRHALLERRRIGHIVFHTAAGAERFGYMDKGKALALRNFALNQVHSAYGHGAD